MESFNRRLEADFGVVHGAVDTSLAFGMARELMVLAIFGLPKAALVGLGAVKRTSSYPFIFGLVKFFQVAAQLGGERRKGQ